MRLVCSVYVIIVVIFGQCEGQEVIEEYEPGQNQGQEGHGTGVHYAYSPIHLTYLAKIEKQIYDTFGEYEQILLDRLDIIRRYRADYENAVVPALRAHNPGDEWDRATHLTSHPLLVYTMVQRYAHNLREFYEDFGKNSEAELMTLLESWRGNYFWPSENDVVQVAKGIFRLQETYDITPSQFTEGFLNGVVTPVGGTARECVSLANVALSLGDTVTAGEWLKAGRQKIAYEGDNSVHMDDFIQYWDRAVRMHGKTWNIDDVNVLDIFQASTSILKQEYEQHKFNTSFENRIHNFKAICRGDINPHLPPYQGHCSLLRGDHDPYFTINPQQLEVHDEVVGVIELHNFFGDELIQQVSNVVYDPIIRANEHDTEKEALFLRTKTTAAAWISEKVPHMESAFRKLGKVLRHRVHNEDEPFFYMQSYSVGNYYEPCVLCEEEIPQVVENSGRRIATAEFIMDTTEAGGDTVFSHLGVKIRPNKGSVVVFREGEGDTGLRGGCPILLGQKWVASKFIYERGQITLRL